MGGAAVKDEFSFAKLTLYCCVISWSYFNIFVSFNNLFRNSYNVEIYIKILDNFIEMVERTGSGIYDMERRLVLGDLSGFVGSSIGNRVSLPNNPGSDFEIKFRLGFI